MENVLGFARSLVTPTSRAHGITVQQHMMLANQIYQVVRQLPTHPYRILLGVGGQLCGVEWLPSGEVRTVPGTAKIARRWRDAAD